jgi:hypothetical protein
MKTNNMVKHNVSCPIWKRLFIHLDYIHTMSTVVPLMFFTYIYDLVWYIPISYILSLIVIIIGDKCGTKPIYGASVMVNVNMGLGLVLHPEYTASGYGLYDNNINYQLSWIVALIIICQIALFIYHSFIYTYIKTDYDSHLIGFIIGSIAGSYLKYS